MNYPDAQLTALALVVRAILRAHPDREAVRRELDASVSHGQYGLARSGFGPMPEELRTALAPFLADLDAPQLPP